MVRVMKEIIKRYINIKEKPIDVEKFIRSFRKKAEEMGYKFFEIEQESSTRKYGEDRIFKFELEKEIDYFAKVNIEIDILFEKLEKVKGRFIGNGTINYIVNLTYDYKNRWGGTAFNSFLFSIYLKVMKWPLENKYLIPYSIIEGNEIFDFIKEELGLY